MHRMLDVMAEHDRARRRQRRITFLRRASVFVVIGVVVVGLGALASMLPSTIGFAAGAALALAAILAAFAVGLIVGLMLAVVFGAGVILGIAVAPTRSSR
jgi:Na+/proline symporter